MRGGEARGGELALAAFVGAAVGFFAARLVASRTDPVAAGELGDPDESWADRWGERVDAAVEAGARGLDGLRRRWRSVPPVDAVTVAGRLAAVEGAEGVRLHDLGDGIVELVGRAREEVGRAAVAAVETAPGVRIVVNRIWSVRDPGAD
jgi:hypothetical protein